MSSSPADLLKGLVGLLDENFRAAEIFQPRHVRLTEFTYVNDEELDKGEELVEENTLELTHSIPSEVAVRDLRASTTRVRRFIRLCFHETSERFELEERLIQEIRPQCKIG